MRKSHKKSDIGARGYSFGWVLYPDEDSNHKAFLDRIIESDVIRSVWIKHDQFTSSELEDENADLKAHVHLISRFPNQRYFSSVIRECESVGVHHTELINDLNNAILYLLHYGSANAYKWQYEKCDLQGDIKLIERACNADVNEPQNRVKELLQIASSFASLDCFKLVYLANHVEDFATYKKYKELFDSVFYADRDMVQMWLNNEPDEIPVDDPIVVPFSDYVKPIGGLSVDMETINELIEKSKGV